MEVHGLAKSMRDMFHDFGQCLEIKENVNCQLGQSERSVLGFESPREAGSFPTP